MPDVCYWESGGIRYTISAGPAGRGAWLSAVGPGSRVRAASLPLGRTQVFDWISQPDAVRTERAEELLRGVLPASGNAASGATAPCDL